MKKEFPIRALFGLRQEDIAMLLGVSRAQWGMFEIGKRDLPLPAKQLLAEMLAYVLTDGKAPKSLPTPDGQQTKEQHQQFERLLRENEYRQLLLARKIAETEKKLTAQARLSLLADFLKSRDAKDEKAANNFLSILRKAGQATAIDHAATLRLQELKIEVLQLEKTLIESKMQNPDL